MIRSRLNVQQKQLFSIFKRTVHQQAETAVDDPKLHHSSTAIQRGKPKIPSKDPLVKNFLVGFVDKQLLAFPEVIPRDDFAKLEKDTWGMVNYFKDSFESTITSQTLNDLKSLGLFGLNIPQLQGGKGYFLSESLLIAEYENISASLGTLFSSHRSVIDVITECGTDLQKEKYLSQLADGSIIATDAIYEIEPTKDDLFNTKATYDVDDHVWILNGEKSFVVNGPTSDLFLVMAQSNPMSLEHEHQICCSIFLLDANTPGVTKESSENKFGDVGVKTCAVSFKNVKLNETNIIGGKMQNHKVGEVYMKYSRLRSSLVQLQLSKKILNHLTSYCINTKQCGTFLKDMDNIKDKIASLLCPIYAVESMIYYTAGMVDEFEDQDVTLETAITKYYSSMTLMKAASCAMEFMGPKALLKGELAEEYFRNAAELFTQGEPIESLRSFIALTGLQHAGVAMQDDVFRSRNPLFNPMHMFKKFIKSSNVDDISTSMGLNEYVHPSLAGPAECIEHCVARLQLCVEMLFNRYGNEIVQRQVEIAKLTEIISTCYAMFSSVSRASRSYCIGLTLSDNELLAATAICLDGKERVKVLAQEIMKGPYLTNDNNLQRMSKQIFKSKHYFIAHPLTYNY
ncbi:ACAD9 family protein [Megaselia abdita]